MSRQRIWHGLLVVLLIAVAVQLSAPPTMIAAAPPESKPTITDALPQSFADVVKNDYDYKIEYDLPDGTHNVFHLTIRGTIVGKENGWTKYSYRETIEFTATWVGTGTLFQKVEQDFNYRGRYILEPDGTTISTLGFGGTGRIVSTTCDLECVTTVVHDVWMDNPNRSSEWVYKVFTHSKPHTK